MDRRQESSVPSPVRPGVAAAPVYLVGFAEALATPEVCFSLRTTGARIVCFCRPMTARKFARLNFVEYQQVSAPEGDINRTVADVEALITRIRPDAVIPCDDTALLVASRLDGGAGHCLTPAGEACQFAIDKWAQIEAARESGFSVMPTRLVENEADVASLPIRPAILKPRAALDIRAGGAHKGRTFIIEAGNLGEQARAALSCGPYLIQEYKVGIGEGLFGIAHAGRVHAGFGHRRLRMMNPAGSGASACVSRKPDPEEFEAAEALLKRVAWKGPFMIELLRDRSGKAWFMEFNGRFWGSLSLARKCGFEMPRLAVDLARGLDPEVPSRVEPGFARHLGRDLVHLLFVLRGPRDGARAHNWPGKIATLRAVMSLHPLRSFYNYDRSQPLFFIKDAAITVSNAILGRST